MNLKNNVRLIGNIGKDPEVNDKYAKISLATNDGYGDNKKTNWHNVVLFGMNIQYVKNYVKKGQLVAISGSLDYKQYEDKWYTSILAENISILSKNDSDLEVF